MNTVWKERLCNRLPRLPWLALLAALCAPLWGCAPSPEVATLQQFKTCEAVSQYIKEQASRINTTDWYNPDQRYFGGMFGGSVMAGAPADMAMPAGEATTTSRSNSANKSSASSGSTNYSQTNVQVAGVDEADIVKNDDKYIYVLRSPYFLMYKAWPAKELKLVGQHKLDGNLTEMFVHNQKVVVFATVNSAQKSSTSSQIYGVTQITVLDISTPESPKELRQVTIEGSYKTSRRVGSMVRVVVHSPLRNPIAATQRSSSSLDPWTQKITKLGNAQAYNQALSTTKLHDWLPTFKEKISKDGATQEINTTPADCSNFHSPSNDAGLGLLTLWSMDMDQPTRMITPTTMVSAYHQTYASAQSLYVATQPLWQGTQVNSHLHKFDTNTKERAKYAASGKFQGQLLNQFSMDEHNDHLRVAVTTNTQVATTNDILIFQQQADELKEVGAVRGLAPGERIYAVRFMGDRGYIVTFRQVDPLFTLDLSKPNAPKAMGELKIPGFSTYLHPLDKDHLLSIGVDGNNFGTNGNLQLALFDVTDFKNPVQKHKLSIPTDQWNNDEALYNHKAFQYYAYKKVLAIPLTGYQTSRSQYDYRNWTSQMMLYNIDIEEGITAAGNVDHKDLIAEAMSGQKESSSYKYGNNTFKMRRAVFMENTLFSISMVGIMANDLSQLSTPISGTVFPK